MKTTIKTEREREREREKKERMKRRQGGDNERIVSYESTKRGSNFRKDKPRVLYYTRPRNFQRQRCECNNEGEREKEE